MNREDFQLAMNNDPKDNFVLLAYADWLDDRGHADEARVYRLIADYQPQLTGPVRGSDTFLREGLYCGDMMLSATSMREWRIRRLIMRERYDPQLRDAYAGYLEGLGRKEDAFYCRWLAMALRGELGDNVYNYKRACGAGGHKSKKAWRLLEAGRYQVVVFGNGPPIPATGSCEPGASEEYMATSTFPLNNAGSRYYGRRWVRTPTSSEIIYQDLKAKESWEALPLLAVPRGQLCS
jgi:uncharacterized protein (TIGR02996 family)